MASFDQPGNPESGISAWIARFAPLIPAGGQILDVAAGRGRHTRWLLDRGHRVTAVDIDATGLRDLDDKPDCLVIEADMEQGQWPFGPASFDAIIVTNYLHRPHFPHLVASLASNGLLLMDCFGRGNERYGRPRNPDFLLQEGELLQAFGSQLQIIAYECGFESHPRPAMRQRLCAARSTAQPWQLDQVPAAD